MRVPYVIGLDLGQVGDPTAMAVTRQLLTTCGEEQMLLYEIPMVERLPLGMSYPDQVDYVVECLLAIPVPRGWPTASIGDAAMVLPHYRLVIDNTGVGRPVGDLFAKALRGIIRVTMTHGFVVHTPAPDEYTVPKRVLVSALQVALQERRVKVARSLPEAATLVKEAHNFQYHLAAKTGDDTYGAWREGKHDDVLFATALAVWHGEFTAPPRRIILHQDYARGSGHPLLRHRATRDMRRRYIY